MIEHPEKWSFTGNVYDRGGDGSRCALCGRPSRFSFEASAKSGRKAFFGSECASKLFNEPAVKEGLEPAIWMLKHKTELYRAARGRRVKHLLLTIREKTDFDIRNLLFIACSGRRFSPRQASLISSLAQKIEFNLSPDLIPVSLSSDKNRSQVRDMKDWEFDNLLAVIPPRQELIAKKIRFFKEGSASYRRERPAV